MEYLDIVDEQGQPTGEIVSRTLAHTKGIRHRTAHIWIVRRENEHFQVLMQKRAMSKDSFPGKYDTSSAGHIQAGDEPLASGLRELAEELGLHAKPEDLAFAGCIHGNFAEEFHGKIFRDNEIAFVYVYQQPVDIETLVLQKEEVESVRWFDLEETYQNCRNRNTQFCAPVPGLELQSLSASSSFSNNVSLRILKAGIKLSRISMIISFTSSSFHIWTDVLRLFNISSHTSASLINPT